ncbi:hypothetical protein JW979_09385 [bacterium]|nr:hypothetical protein [candidate division CSSED10-310 bacterium]
MNENQKTSVGTKKSRKRSRWGEWLLILVITAVTAITTFFFTRAQLNQTEEASKISAEESVTTPDSQAESI